MLRKLELEAAASQLQNAERRLAVENQLADLKIEAARLGLKKAEAAALGLAAQQKKVELLMVSLALAKKDQQRLSGLSTELATDQERERQALLVQQAGCELESAQATMDQFTRTSRLGIEAARLDLAAAEAAKKQLPFAIPIESLRTNHRLAACAVRSERNQGPMPRNHPQNLRPAGRNDRRQAGPANRRPAADGRCGRSL